MMFHQSCEFNSFWNNQKTEFQADGAEFTHFYLHQLLTCSLHYFYENRHIFLQKAQFITKQWLCQHI